MNRCLGNHCNGEFIFFPTPSPECISSEKVVSSRKTIHVPALRKNLYSLPSQSICWIEKCEQIRRKKKKHEEENVCVCWLVTISMGERRTPRDLMIQICCGPGDGAGGTAGTRRRRSCSLGICVRCLISTGGGGGVDCWAAMAPVLFSCCANSLATKLFCAERQMRIVCDGALMVQCISSSSSLMAFNRFYCQSFRTCWGSREVFEAS